MKDRLLMSYAWLKDKVKHKLEHYSLAHFKELLRRHGLALLVIFIIWEIVEDILFPVLFPLHSLKRLTIHRIYLSLRAIYVA